MLITNIEKEVLFSSSNKELYLFDKNYRENNLDFFCFFNFLIKYEPMCPAAPVINTFIFDN